MATSLEARLTSQTMQMLNLVALQRNLLNLASAQQTVLRHQQLIAELEQERTWRGADRRQDARDTDGRRRRTPR